MEFQRTLSNKGVDLFAHDNDLLVVRKLSSEKLGTILDFYEESSFAYRPKIIRSDMERGELHEEYIQGGDLSIKQGHYGARVGNAIGMLSKQTCGKIDMKIYLHNRYKAKVDSLVLTPEQLEITQKYFGHFMHHAQDGAIVQNWIHGDLKNDNIVENDRDGQIYLIDWEWANVGCLMEDVSRYVQSSLQGKPREVDVFLDAALNASSHLNYDLYARLDGFYNFLNQIVSLSKGRIDIGEFCRNVENAMDTPYSHNF